MPKKKNIKQSLKKIYSPNFKKILKNNNNPYENGLPSKKIVRILKNFKFQNSMKKSFFNLKFKFR